MKLSMSMSSSKSTVRMYLISDPLGVSYVSPSGNVGFSEIKRIETFEPGPQYYRIASHYDTLRKICGHTLGRICPPNYLLSDCFASNKGCWGLLAKRR